MTTFSDFLLATALLKSKDSTCKQETDHEALSATSRVGSGCGSRCGSGCGSRCGSRCETVGVSLQKVRADELLGFHKVFGVSLISFSETTSWVLIRKTVTEIELNGKAGFGLATLEDICANLSAHATSIHFFKTAAMIDLFSLS